MRRRLIGLAVLFATTMALAACGGGGDEAATPEPEPAADNVVAPDAQPEARPEPPAEPPPEPVPSAEPQAPAEAAGLSREDYIGEADLICAELDERSEALAEPQTFDEIAEWAVQLDQIADEGLARLALLEPPADDRSGADALFDNLVQQAEIIPFIELAARSEDEPRITELVEQVTDLAVQADDIARGYGFRECGIDDSAQTVDGAAPGQDAGDLILNYVPAESEAIQGTIDAIQDAGVLEALVEGVNDTLALPEDINVFVQEQTPGPAYFPDFSEILMPPEFADTVFSMFADSGYVESSDDAKDLTDAVLAFVFVHELGHALTHQLQLPITGLEEDAADQLATVVVTSAGEDAGGIAIAGAALFGLLGENREAFEAADFWDEHSLDEQRFFNILCWVYGSDPATYGEAVLESGIGEDRLVRCEDEWTQISDAWETLLAPHVKG